MNKFITLKFLLAFLCSTFAFIVSAQTDSISSKPSSQQVLELLEDIRVRQIKNTYENRYKMYPTENLYNLLKLDTQTGKIEQVQWSLDDDKEFTSTINNQDLSWETGMNSFELYPTQNMYQFVLLDKATGRTWHVQWGLEDRKRWIRRIF